LEHNLGAPEMTYPTTEELAEQRRANNMQIRLTIPDLPAPES